MPGEPYTGVGTHITRTSLRYPLLTLVIVSYRVSKYSRPTAAERLQGTLIGSSRQTRSELQRGALAANSEGSNTRPLSITFAISA
jgi:hypothetical protein